MSAEPTRTMTLNYLLMMGIDITENDKISDERIAKRLLKALDCAQLASKWLSGPQLNPSQMEKWDDSESLNVALRRGNPVDGHRLARPDIEAKFKKPNAPINAFRDLRTSINQLGELWDKGQRVTRFRCEDKLYAITMRVSPAFLPSYSFVTFCVIDGRGCKDKKQNSYDSTSLSCNHPSRTQPRCVGSHVEVCGGRPTKLQHSC